MSICCKACKSSRNSPNELSKVEETINNDLISADVWFARNGMKRKSSKYQAMVLGKTKELMSQCIIKCDESQLLISNTMELLGVAIDDKLNFEKHIAKICRKVFFCLTDWKSYHKEGLSNKKKKQRKKKGKKIKAVLLQIVTNSDSVIRRR